MPSKQGLSRICPFSNKTNLHLELLGRRGGSVFIRKQKKLKDKVFGQDIPETSGTQTSGYPGQKFYASGLFLREWPGCPGIWVGTCQERREGRGREGVCGKWGGLNVFCRGRNSHQV